MLVHVLKVLSFCKVLNRFLFNFGSDTLMLNESASDLKTLNNLSNGYNEQIPISPT